MRPKLTKEAFSEIDCDEQKKHKNFLLTQLDVLDKNDPLGCSHGSSIEDKCLEHRSELEYRFVNLHALAHIFLKNWYELHQRCEQATKQSQQLLEQDEKNAEIANQLKSQKTANNILRGELSKAKNQTRSMQQKLDKFTNELTAEKEKTKESQSNSSVANSKLGNQLKQSEQTIKTLRQQIETERKKFKSAIEVLNKQQATEKTKLEKELSAINVKLASQSQAHAAELNQLQMDYQKKITELTAELESEKLELTEIDKLKAEISKLKQDINALNKTIESQRRQIESLGKMPQVKFKSNQCLSRQQVSSVDAELINSPNEHIQQLLCGNADLRNQVSSLHMQIKKKTTAFEQLAATVIKPKPSVDFTQLITERNVLRAALVKANQRANEIQSKALEIQNYYEDIAYHNQLLQHENAELRYLLQSLQAQCSSWQQHSHTRSVVINQRQDLGDPPSLVLPSPASSVPTSNSCSLLIPPAATGAAGGAHISPVQLVPAMPSPLQANSVFASSVKYSQPFSTVSSVNGSDGWQNSPN